MLRERLPMRRAARRLCRWLLLPALVLLLALWSSGCTCTSPDAWFCGIFQGIRVENYLLSDTWDCVLVGEPFACVGCEEFSENGSFEYDRDGAALGWLGDSTRVVGAEQGVEPCSRRRMLRFLTSQPYGPDPSNTAEAYQLIDLRDAVLPGEAVIRTRVLANRRLDTPSTEFGIGVDAYAGDPEAPFPSSGHRLLGSRSARIFSDNRPETWEQVRASLALPPGTDFLFVWTWALQDSLNTPTRGVFDGHYADGLRVMIGPDEPYDLQVEYSASAETVYSGDDVAFTVVVANTGPYPLSSAIPEVAVDVQLPSFARHRGHEGDGRFDPATGRWTVRAPDVGQRLVLTIRTRVFYQDPRGIVFPATAHSSVSIATVLPDDHDPGSNTAALSLMVGTRTAADFAVTKAVDRTAVAGGDTVVFTMVFTAEDYGYPQGVLLLPRAVDRLPAGLEYVDHQPADAYDPETGVWSVAGRFGQIYDTLTVRAVARATATNRVALQFESAHESIDVDSGNNSASVTVTVVEEPSGCRILSAGGPESRFACVGTDPYCRQLVANASFEAPVTLGSGLRPAAAGVWESANPTASVTAQQDVSPCSGLHMLQFVGGNTSFQTQAVNLTPEEQNLVAAGKARLVARALFNRVAGDAQTDTRFFLRIFAYPGTYPDSYVENQPALAVGVEVVDTDDDPGTWEESYVAFVPPPTTGYLLVQVVAQENVRDDQQSPEYDGHFADDVRVVLAPLAAQ